MLFSSFLFSFKKTVSRLFFPASLIFYPLLIGVLLLWFGKSPRKKKWGKIAVSTSLAILVFLACGPFSLLILRTLESRYEPLDQHAVQAEFGEDWKPRYVVVLAGDFFPGRGLLPSTTVGPRTQSRMSEGIRIQALYPDSMLIFTGGRIKDDDPYSIADQMARLAEIWGVDPGKIIAEEESRDTKDHAIFVGKIVEENPLVIVTSAAHMPRSMALFEAAGMAPVAAPANFRTRGKIGFSWNWFVPKISRLDYAENALYEYMGLAWAKLRGQI
ncbi:MAG: uncharacterized SAM-binding protein YcdF (DUF218 family) [Verrucomicrobiales bacterium]|jgi:uncharacterized SAM-binding protein YcdF (DUF218 family)